MSWEESRVHAASQHLGPTGSVQHVARQNPQPSRRHRQRRLGTQGDEQRRSRKHSKPRQCRTSGSKQVKAVLDIGMVCQSEVNRNLAPWSSGETSSKHDEKELLHCTSLGYRDIQCTHSHPEHYPLPVSREPELDLAHTHQCCDYSLSPAAEQSGESHHVLTKLHGYGMEGKRRRIASFAGSTGPRAPLRSNFDDPEGWDTSFSEEECSQQDVVQRMVPVAGSPIIMCGCSGSCSLSAVENVYQAGKKPATCQTCGRLFPRPNSRNVSPVTSRRSRNTSPAMSRRSSVVS